MIGSKSLVARRPASRACVRTLIVINGRAVRCAMLEGRRSTHKEATMPDFILLTRLSPEGLRSPSSLETLEKRTVKEIEQACPGVEWRHCYAILGPYDYLDIFSAPDIETAFKVSAILRTLGRSHAEVWAATEWRAFKAIIDSIG
ncbi:GYD domain-containing protein [Burkholderia thailandensis]|nr:GYD domain-containing protein [Burkholderia thailandensis]MDD1483305.1 GYD domain-containing protein [Burkholderia thailandensis]MDD1489434.1 GYD domain-containing protein [Burkholderia thailandensis]MDD1495532.1 GYD domain-containing protein [Burkholderia thailandensis]TGB28924.1 GYD domain-containing protein [Burkholderia thailandensis]